MGGETAVEKRDDMKIIGILSDTHGLLRPEVMQSLQGCDAILHGGDINKPEIITRLEQIAPVYAVRGNNDKEWAEHLPLFLDFTLYGLRVFMTHKKKDLPQNLEGYNLAVYGHSHRYEQKSDGETCLINPGSCGPRRFNQDITMAVLELTDQTDQRGKIRIRRIDIPHVKPPVMIRDNLQKTDIDKVIREVRKGRSVTEISVQLRLDPEITEQICRLYLTHPGVDAEGIMAKMGL